MAWWGFGAGPPIPLALLAAALAAAGWLAGVRYTRHELLGEIARAVRFAKRLEMPWNRLKR
jgi:cell division protein FtsL